MPNAARPALFELDTVMLMAWQRAAYLFEHILDDLLHWGAHGVHMKAGSHICCVAGAAVHPAGVASLPRFDQGFSQAAVALPSFGVKTRAASAWLAPGCCILVCGAEAWHEH